ncbi:hypothetical protein C0995_009608 [Termitomyces sp. Mi166|nr:hypothetical protein C0995_009608 [Termitomyces sp. Mi166\
MLLWCVLEGGGMTVEESRKAWLAHYDAKHIITPSGGSVFTIKGNSDAIAAYILLQGRHVATLAKAKFAGLATDALPDTGSINKVETLKFDMLVVIEKESRVVID